MGVLTRSLPEKHKTDDDKCREDNSCKRTAQIETALVERFIEKITDSRAERAGTPDAYSAFAARLARYRPTQSELLYQPGTPLCKNAPTDMSGVDIVWSELSGASQHLNVHYGCGPLEMRDALRTAPELLSIAAFIADR